MLPSQSNEGMRQQCFMHIRNINKIKSFLSFNNLIKTVVNALIYSRLDYCNALYSGINQSLLHRLQLVQNAAARLITGTRRYDHITPVLAELHWLPVSFRIDFKILLLTFKAVNGLAPGYLSAMVETYEPTYNLRSAGRGLLKESNKLTLVTRGDRAFSVRAPKLWNSLPEKLRLTNSLTSFKTLLKTHFYRKAFPSPWYFSPSVVIAVWCLIVVLLHCCVEYWFVFTVQALCNFV